MSENVREKIRKLLALATSSNEHEAKLALLKAKEMMVKHKMSEADVEGLDKQKMVHVDVPEVKWTTDSGNLWMVSLASVICDEHCCVGAWKFPPKSRTHILTVSGMADDVSVCSEVVKFAAMFVLHRTKRYAPSFRISYAEGFVMGLKMAYELQKEEHPEWGLVVVKPKEVEDYASKLGSKDVRMKQVERDKLAFMRGQNDGLHFNDKKVISRI